MSPKIIAAVLAVTASTVVAAGSVWADSYAKSHGTPAYSEGCHVITDGTYLSGGASGCLPAGKAKYAPIIQEGPRPVIHQQVHQVPEIRIQKVPVVKRVYEQRIEKVPVVKRIEEVQIQKVPVVKRVYEERIEKVPVVKRVEVPIVEKVPVIKRVYEERIEKVPVVKRVEVPVIQKVYVPQVVKVPVPVRQEVPQYVNSGVQVHQQHAQAQHQPVGVIQQQAHVRHQAVPVLSQRAHVQVQHVPVIGQAPQIMHQAVPVLRQHAQIHRQIVPVYQPQVHTIPTAVNYGTVCTNGCPRYVHQPQPVYMPTTYRHTMVHHQTYQPTVQAPVIQPVQHMLKTPAAKVTTKLIPAPAPVATGGTTYATNGYTTAGHAASDFVQGSSVGRYAQN